MTFFITPFHYTDCFSVRQIGYGGIDEIAALTKERHGLYRSAPDSPRIGQITARLKVLRKEIRMCGRIEKHSMEIGQRLAEARAEQKKYVEKEKQKGADKAEKRRDALQRDSRFH